MSQPTTTRHDAEIIRLREAGRTCREVATALGIPEWHVYRCMSRNGLAGRFHYAGRLADYHAGRRAERELTAAGADEDGIRLRQALASYDAVTIERGLGGGYVATIDDAWTGEERATIAEAIRDAQSRKEAR